MQSRMDSVSRRPSVWKIKPPNRVIDSISPCIKDFLERNRICRGIAAAQIIAAIQNLRATNRIGDACAKLIFTSVNVLPQIKVMRINARSA